MFLTMLYSFEISKNLRIIKDLSISVKKKAITDEMYFHKIEWYFVFSNRM